MECNLKVAETIVQNNFMIGQNHLLLINQLIKKVGYHPLSNNKINDFILQISTLSFSLYSHYINNLDYLRKSSFVYSLKQFDKSSSIQYFMLIICYITICKESKHSKSLLFMIHHLVLKLYQEKHYDNISVNLISTLMIKFDSNDFLIEDGNDNVNIYDNQKEIVIIKQNEKTLYGVYLNYLDNIIKINNDSKYTIILNSLDYFIKEIINKSLLFLLSKDMFYLEHGYLLIQNLIKLKSNTCESNNDNQIKSIIHKLDIIITSIYRYNFTKQTLKYFILTIKSMLINFESKTESESIQNIVKQEYHLQIIQKTMKSEGEIEKNDQSCIQTGFIFQGRSIKGIKAPVNSKIKHFTLIFSFKLIPFPNDNHLIQSYPLISFISKEIKSKTEINQLQFSIEIKDDKYKLLFYLNNRGYDQDIIIQPYTSYNIIIVLSPSPLGPSKKTIKIKYNETVKDITLDTFTLENIDCYLGYSCSNNADNQYSVFQGEIGTVIFIKDILSDQILQNFTYLKGYYNMILYSAYKYDLDYINKYTSINLVKDKMTKNARNWIKKQRHSFCNSIEFVISPLCIQSINDNQRIIKVNEKKSYKFNSLFVNPNQHIIEDKMKLLCPISNYFNIFERKMTLFEFIMGDGFSFIILHLEYYYSIVSLLKINNTNLLINQM